MDAVDPEGPAEGFVSLKEIALSEEHNPVKRKDMEDASIIIDEFLGLQDVAYLALFDGHGGKEVAKFCVENAHTILTEAISGRNIQEIDDEELEQVLTKVLRQLDDEVLKMPEYDEIGCTAVICISDKKRNRLTVSNVGDSRVVLCAESGPTRATVDHRTTTDGEEERIESLGGYVRNNRVNGVISVTRSIGDKHEKRFLQPIAHTATYKLSDIKRFVIGCDGLFDVVTDEDVCRIALKYKGCPDTANELVEEAMIRDSGDNISVIVAQPW